MNKKELAGLISARTGKTDVETLETISTMLDVINETIKEGHQIYLRGFGRFYLKKVKEKKARDIGRNIQVIIPEHDKIAFNSYL